MGQIIIALRLFHEWQVVPWHFLFIDHFTAAIWSLHIVVLLLLVGSVTQIRKNARCWIRQHQRFVFIQLQEQALQTEYQRPADRPLEGASWPSSTGWHRAGLQGGPRAGHHRLATPEPTLLLTCLPLSLLMFHFTGFGCQQPTSSHHSADSSSTGLASSLVPLDSGSWPSLCRAYSWLPAAHWRANECN